MISFRNVILWTSNSRNTPQAWKMPYFYHFPSERIAKPLLAQGFCLSSGNSFYFTPYNRNYCKRRSFDHPDWRVISSVPKRYHIYLHRKWWVLRGILLKDPLAYPSETEVSANRLRMPSTELYRSAPSTTRLSGRDLINDQILQNIAAHHAEEIAV